MTTHVYRRHLLAFLTAAAIILSMNALIFRRNVVEHTKDVEITYGPNAAMIIKCKGIETSDFNKFHPEMHQGEVFVGNYYDALAYNTPWQTKRLGHTAYDICGTPLPKASRLRPLFVQKEEVAHAGYDTNTM